MNPETSHNDFIVEKRGMFFVLIVLFVFLISLKISFLSTDIPRYLRSGYDLIHHPGEISKIIHTNFFSYTNTNFGIVNHHWASGIIFYIVQTTTGYVGLSIFYSILSVLVLLVFFKIAYTFSNYWIGWLSAFVTLPLITYRFEIRPEVFTVLFCGIFFLLFIKYSKGEIGKRAFLAIPLIELLWVNLHLGFIFGCFLICAYTLYELIRRKIEWHRVTYLVYISIATLAVTLINPSGIQGVLYPFTSLNNYGLSITVESQSIMTLVKNGVTPLVLIYSLIFIIVIICFGILALLKRAPFSSYLPLVLGIPVAFLAIQHVRNISLFGFFAIPLFAVILNALIKENEARFKITLMALIGIIAAVCVGYISYDRIHTYGPRIGWGILPGTTAGANFFAQHPIQGPIFNEVNVGAYLIDLNPTQKVFIDNRLEAYPDRFIKNNYQNLLQNNDAWNLLDGYYHFKAIVISKDDRIPLIVRFLDKRLTEGWHPVYNDTYIFVLEPKIATSTKSL